MRFALNAMVDIIFFTIGEFNRNVRNAVHDRMERRDKSVQRCWPLLMSIPVPLMYADSGAPGRHKGNFS